VRHRDEGPIRIGHHGQVELPCGGQALDQHEQVAGGARFLWDQNGYNVQSWPLPSCVVPKRRSQYHRGSVELLEFRITVVGGPNTAQVVFVE
jgi:hypothetical protein